MKSPRRPQFAHASDGEDAEKFEERRCLMGDFDREVRRIHRRRVAPNLLFSTDTATVVIIALLCWLMS